MIGVTDDAEAAILYVWDNPGTTSAPVSQLRFEVDRATSNVGYEAMRAAWPKTPSAYYGGGLATMPTVYKWTEFWNRLVREGTYPDKKIQAIKEVRTEWGLGLGEAKAVIDNVWAAV